MKMKLLMCVLTFVMFATASAQTRLGILAGGLNARHTEEVTDHRKSSDFGWQGGLFVKHDFAKTKLTVELNVLAFGYDNIIESDGKYEIQFVDEYGITRRGGGARSATIKHLGVSTPLLIKYNVNKFHPFVGFQFELSSSKTSGHLGSDIAWVDPFVRTQTYENKIEVHPSNQDYGFLAGLEFDVTQSLGVRFTYSKGMNEVLRYDFTTGILNGEGGTKFSESTRKETFSLNVVYTPQWRKLHFKKGTEPKEKVPLKERMKELY